MTNKQIKTMLKEIVAEIDYDIYKQLFVESCMEDKDASKESVDRLIQIVKKYAPKE